MTAASHAHRVAGWAEAAGLGACLAPAAGHSPSFLPCFFAAAVCRFRCLSPQTWMARCSRLLAYIVAVRSGIRGRVLALPSHACRPSPWRFVAFTLRHRICICGWSHHLIGPPPHRPEARSAHHVSASPGWCEACHWALGPSLAQPGRSTTRLALSQPGRLSGCLLPNLDGRICSLPLGSWAAVSALLQFDDLGAQAISTIRAITSRWG